MPHPRSLVGLILLNALRWDLNQEVQLSTILNRFLLPATTGAGQAGQSHSMS